MRYTTAFILGMLLVVFRATAQPASAPATSPTTGPADPAKFQAIRAQLTAAEAEAKRLEGLIYAKDPALKQQEDEYARLQESAEETHAQTNALVADYFLAQPDARAAYQQLYEQWQRLANIDAMSEPAKAEMLKAVLLYSGHDWRREAEQRARQGLGAFAAVKTYDEFWKAHCDYIQGTRLSVMGGILKLQKDSKLPEYCLTQAKEDAYSKFTLDMLYQPYLFLRTPRELQQARRNVHDLEIKLTNLWPQWQEAESGQ